MRINLWPYVIVAMIIGAIVASLKTIVIALENPVQDSNLFLQNYHITDKNINEILYEQALFSSKYSLDVSKSVVSKEKLDFHAEILESENSEFEILMTRPETVGFDEVFKTPDFSFEFPKEGRWKIHLKVSIEDITAYFYFEVDREKEELILLDPFVSQKRVERIEEMRQKRIQELIGEERY
jgi:hypothetical protein